MCALDTGHYVYIDESGDKSIAVEKNGASRLFVCAAVLISGKENRNEVRSGVEEVQKKYFPKGEIKSSRVANNHQRRTSILQELNKLDYKFIALIVDKERIYKDSGLRFGGSFYKFMKNMPGYPAS